MFTSNYPIFKGSSPGGSRAKFEIDVKNGDLYRVTQNQTDGQTDIARPNKMKNK